MAVELFQSDFEQEREARYKAILELYRDLVQRYPNASMNRICKTIGKEFKMSPERVRVICKQEE